MRLRTPAQELTKKLDPQSIPEAKGHQVSYTVKVITPIYGGGVEAGVPDEDMPIRATAIRGQLRYWWRFLQSHHLNEDRRLSGTALFNREREIWGGMSDDPTKDYSSKIFIKINNKSPYQSGPCCEYTSSGTDSRGKTKYSLAFLHDIPQYAMFPGQGKSPSSPDYDERTDKPHNVLLPDIIFTLSIKSNSELNEDDWNSILNTLRWWSCFGGLGARTRRGLGSVEIEGLESVTREEAAKYGCELRRINAASPMAAWNTAIKKLHHFRQGVGEGRNQKKDQNGGLVFWGKKPNQVPAQGGSRWPEPDSLREICKTHSKRHRPTHKARLSFPRAAFGLPIIFKFNNQDEKQGDPQQTEIRPNDSERMASPLILKAMATHEGYKAIALLLPDTALKNLRLQLHGIPDKPDGLTPEKENEWKEKDWEKWPENWWETNKSGLVKPINNRGSDALNAFLEFFGGQ